MVDRSLDESGWTPYALERIVEIGGRLSYEESEKVLRGFGYEVSRAEIGRIVGRYGEKCKEEVRQVLKEQAYESLETSKEKSRVMVLEQDGVRVLGRAEGGECGGIEIKTAVIYPEQSPSERVMIADVMEAQEFNELVSGLIRAGKVRVKDRLIGVGDGGAWVERGFEELGIPYINDVYHATGYLDTLMEALGWDETIRAKERAKWCRADVSAASWLANFPLDTKLLEKAEVAVAYRYLCTRQQRMDYPSYKAQGFPIASGQVEGMNKFVIGKRLKQSGMQWSRKGAAAMAALRAWLCSKHPLVSFLSLRFIAFPVPQI